MKHYFKRISVLALFLIFSCGKDDDNGEVNRAPAISAQIFSFSEDLGPANIIGKVAATDPDGDALTYSISTNDNDLFEIAANADLSLVAGASLDYETATSHTITVSVSDGKLSSNAQITINVLDIEENVAPQIAAQTFNVEENQALNAEIATIVASDPNSGNILLYTITQNAFLNGGTTQPMFEFVDDRSGKLRLSPKRFLDFENETSYTITVQVSDGVLTASAVITINVTDVNEAPVFRDSSNVEDEVAEDIDDTVVIATIVATDPEDGTALNLSLVNNTDGLFEINTSGEISLAPGKNLDYETATSHTVTVRVTDSGLLSTTESFTFDVTDVVETATGTIAVSTFAGSGVRGNTNATGTMAQFNGPTDIAINGAGELFITDSGNNQVRRAHAGTKAVTRFTGSGTRGGDDGAATVATFSSIFGLSFDSSGIMYVVDAGNRKVRKVVGSGTVSTYAGTGTSGLANGDAIFEAQFNNPNKVAIDNADNLYITDANNHAIRKITPGGRVTTLAGGSNSVGGFADGTGGAARFDQPRGITIDNAGNLYVIDAGNHRVRKITPSGVVTTIAGQGVRGFREGPAATARFNFTGSSDIVINPFGGDIYVSDSGNSRIRKITSTGDVSTLAGTGAQSIVNGNESTATFHTPGGMAIDVSGNLYVCEPIQHVIRKITFNKGVSVQ